MSITEQDYDDYHDDLDDDGEDMAFDCPRWWVPDAFDGKGGWYCPAQGSEDCDWECPYS